MTAAAWGGVSVALDLASFIPFLWAALSGRARPSKISWSMWSAEYWVLFASEVTYGSGLASVWIAVGEAAGSTTLAALGWLQHLASRNRPGRPSRHPGRTYRPAGRDLVRDRWRRLAGHADDDPPRWLTLTMTAGVTTALAAWQLSTGFTAIILAVAVDLMAACVNACKTYRHPAGESILSWWLFLAATIAALLAVGARRADPVRLPRRRRAHRHRSDRGLGHRQAGWFASHQPTRSRSRPDTTPQAAIAPGASDHSKSVS